jgi:PEP-CTERM motif
MKSTKKIYGFALALTCSLGATVRAQDIYVFDSSRVGEYGLDGSTVNTSLIPGLSQPEGLAISGNYLFVANFVSGTIGEYGLDGSTVNASLITGLSGPNGITVSGNDLFVANIGADPGTGTIGEYGLDGSTVNASLISGLNFPIDLEFSGDDLFVLNVGVLGRKNQGDGSIGEYTTSGGTVNATLITGLTLPAAIAISPVPEPSTLALLAVGASVVVLRLRRDTTLRRYKRPLSLLRTPEQ